jgi:hypothetical protein
MYKPNVQKGLDLTKHLLLWLKRKTLLIIAAFMIGIGNTVEGTDHSVIEKEDRTEQEDKRG